MRFNSGRKGVNGRAELEARIAELEQQIRQIPSRFLRPVGMTQGSWLDQQGANYNSGDTAIADFTSLTIGTNEPFVVHYSFGDHSNTSTDGFMIGAVRFSYDGTTWTKNSRRIRVVDAGSGLLRPSGSNVYSISVAASGTWFTIDSSTVAGITVAFQLRFTYTSAGVTRIECQVSQTGGSPAGSSNGQASIEMLPF
jgi:hypothetical protein